SRSPERAAVASACTLSGSMSGWFELFQLPLDSHTTEWSLIATLVWYALGKIHVLARGSSRSSAQACVSSSLKAKESIVTVTSSVWSLVPFGAGWSRHRATVLPGSFSIHQSRMCHEVKSYTPIVRDSVVAPRNALRTGQPASGLAQTWSEV